MNKNTKVAEQVVNYEVFSSQTSNAVKPKIGYRHTLKSLLPYGMLATKKWLAEQGLSAHSLDNAVKTETLLPLATGVYCLYSRRLNWEGVVASMQRMEKLPNTNTPPMLVGGVSALALSGLSHYVSLSQKPHIDLYSANKLPAWFARLSLPLTFSYYSTSRLWPNSVNNNNAFVREHSWSPELPPVYFSCPEKAILELLVNLPDSVTFEHADELMQGLVNLSPRKLHKLLLACKSVKAKRLFFWLAQRHAYPWFSKLSVSDYDLGSGKRVVAKAGKLDARYLITVPSHMVSDDKF